MPPIKAVTGELRCKAHAMEARTVAIVNIEIIFMPNMSKKLYAAKEVKNISANPPPETVKFSLRYLPRAKKCPAAAAAIPAK